jgi:hypothetical protein
MFERETEMLNRPFGGMGGTLTFFRLRLFATYTVLVVMIDTLTLSVSCFGFLAELE